MLTQWDIHQIEQHLVYGVELMQQHELIEKSSLDIILNHHEKLNGSGYPRQLPGSSLGYETRLCSVVDIFDALTSRRAYKPALTGFEALRLMTDKMKKEIDTDITQLLIQVLGPNQNRMRAVNALLV